MKAHAAETVNTPTATVPDAGVPAPVADESAVEVVDVDDAPGTHSKTHKDCVQPAGQTKYLTAVAVCVTGAVMSSMLQFAFVYGEQISDGGVPSGFNVVGVCGLCQAQIVALLYSHLAGFHRPTRTVHGPGRGYRRRRYQVADYRSQPSCLSTSRRPVDNACRGKRGVVRRCGPSRRLAARFFAGSGVERRIRRLSAVEKQDLGALRVDGLGRFDTQILEGKNKGCIRRAKRGRARVLLVAQVSSETECSIWLLSFFPMLVLVLISSCGWLTQFKRRGAR